MKLARVVATVVSTINSPIYDNRRLLLCDVLDPEGRPTGKYTIAIDQVDAGAGETVIVLDEGNSARQMLSAPDAPVRAIVAGIVDEVALEPEEDDTGTAQSAKTSSTVVAVKTRSLHPRS